MSGNLAFALPTRAPQRQPDASRPHIEIVATRTQRLARPRLAYSLIVVAGLFAVLASQLLLSIALADGAYQISALHAQQRDLSRQRQSLAEELNVLNSPQNLAARAESLGMVINSSAVYLSLADGSVTGTPQAARAGAGSVVGSNGSLLISNSLLDDVPATMAGAMEGDTGAPDSAATPGLVASTSIGIPGPTTR